MEQSEKASHSDNVVTGCEAQPTNLHVSQIQFISQWHDIQAKSNIDGTLSGLGFAMALLNIAIELKAVRFLAQDQ